MRFSICRQLRMYHSDMDVLFSYFSDEVCNRHGLHSDMDARRMRAHARMLVNASFVELFLATQSSCVNMSVGGHELV